MTGVKVGPGLGLRLRFKLGRFHDWGLCLGLGHG